MDYSIGDILDWVVCNWQSLIVVVALLTGIIKITRKVDKIRLSVEASDKSITERLPKIEETLSEHSIRFDEMASHLESLKEDRSEEKKRSSLIIEGVKASLEGLREVGANGPTGEALRKLDVYMIEKSTK